jgi:hypothetical protein
MKWLRIFFENSNLYFTLSINLSYKDLSDDAMNDLKE